MRALAEGSALSGGKFNAVLPADRVSPKQESGGTRERTSQQHTISRLGIKENIRAYTWIEDIFSAATR